MKKVFLISLLLVLSAGALAWCCGRCFIIERDNISKNYTTYHTNQCITKAMLEKIEIIEGVETVYGERYEVQVGKGECFGWRGIDDEVEEVLTDCWLDYKDYFIKIAPR